jgi:hypothetical protein
VISGQSLQAHGDPELDQEELGAGAQERDRQRQVAPLDPQGDLRMPTAQIPDGECNAGDPRNQLDGGDGSQSATGHHRGDAQREE